MHGSQRRTTGTEGPPPGPRYRRHLAEQPRPAASAGPDPFASGTAEAPGSEQGPDFYASFESECEAAVCFEGGTIFEGDLIRAVGHREYAHAACADEECDA